MYWAGVGMYFVSFACRTLRWCGAPPSSSAPTARQGLQNIAFVEANGFSDKTQPVSLRNGSLRNIDCKENILLSHVHGSSLPEKDYSAEATIQDAISSSLNSMSVSEQDSDHLPQPLAMQGADSTEESLMKLRNVEIGVSSEKTLPVPEESSHSISPEIDASRPVPKLLDRWDSISADSNSSDASITEVTNDLLSLTYQTYEESRTKEGAEPSLKSFHVEANMEDDREGRVIQEASEPECKDIASSEDPHHEANLEHYPIAVEEEGNDAEDVRSLYPDVVVISSEEEIYSGSNSSGSIVSENISLHSEVDPELEKIDEVLQIENPCHDINNSQCSMSHNDSNTESVAKPLNPEALPVDTKIPSSMSALVEDSESSLTDDVSGDEEIVSPLKDSSFVEKLEKIIGAQSLKFKPSSYPPLQKSSSLTQFRSINVYNNFGMNREKSLSSSSEALVDLQHSKILPTGTVEADMTSQENNDEKLGINSLMEQSNQVDEDMGPEPVRDIRAKLERIFSSGSLGTAHCLPTQSSATKSPEASPTRSTFAAKDLYEKNFAKNDLASSRTEHSQEMDEVRKRMVNVLGSIRLKSD